MRAKHLATVVTLLVGEHHIGAANGEQSPSPLSATAVRDHIETALGRNAQHAATAIALEADVVKVLNEHTGTMPPSLVFDTELAIMGSDRFVRRERVGIGSGQFITTQGYAGNHLLDGVRVAGGDARGAMRVDPVLDLARHRRQAARWRALLCLSGLSPAPVSFAVKGRETVDGLPGYALDVTGPDGFRGSLLVNAQTWLPHSLRYRKPEPAIPGGTVVSAATGTPGGEHPPLIESVWTASDYRTTEAGLFPYRMTERAQGKIVEEWTVRRVRVNTAVSADVFAK